MLFLALKHINRFHWEELIILIFLHENFSASDIFSKAQLLKDWWAESHLINELSESRYSYVTLTLTTCDDVQKQV